MNRSVSGLSGLPIFRCFQLTCFRTHQFRSHTPLLSILYPRPYHRFFTGYVFSKECKKGSCVPGRRFHHHADCAEALVFSLFEADYVSFLDIKTTVSTCPETVEKIIILLHAVWELVKVGTCCSGICQKYDAPLPSMISATLQNTLNWNLTFLFS